MWNNNSNGERKMEKCVQVMWECKTDCRRKKDKKRKSRKTWYYFFQTKGKILVKKFRTSKYFPYCKDSMQPSDKLHELHLRLGEEKLTGWLFLLLRCVSQFKNESSSQNTYKCHAIFSSGLLLLWDSNCLQWECPVFLLIRPLRSKHFQKLTVHNEWADNQSTRNKPFTLATCNHTHSF